MISKQVIKLSDGTGGYISDGAYGRPPGNFFIFEGTRTSGTARETIGCRETLFNRMKDTTKHVGYYLPGLKVKKVNEFIEELEKRMKPKIPMAIYTTQYPNAIVFYIPPFWRSEATRRSFWSLFIRCACGFYVDDFDKALKSYQYAVQIRGAIDAFIEGNTVPMYKNGVGGGVVEKFNGMSKAQIVNKMLRKPKTKKLKSTK